MENESLLGKEPLALVKSFSFLFLITYLCSFSSPFFVIVILSIGPSFNPLLSQHHKMANGVGLLEAKVFVLDDSLKSSLEGFRQSLLLEALEVEAELWVVQGTP